MDVRKEEGRRLTRDDWAGAALAAIARGGIDAIAVETVAAELGATKGSFYWHFANRDALIQAALERWEQRRTEAVIEMLEKIPDPAGRLATLMQAGVALGPGDRAEIALLGNPGHPAALKAVRRAARRRIEYIAQQLEALGWTAQEAHDRAVLIYYVYVGHMQMSHVAPRAVKAEARRRQVDVAFKALVEPPS